MSLPLKAQIVHIITLTLTPPPSPGNVWWWTFRWSFRRQHRSGPADRVGGEYKNTEKWQAQIAEWEKGAEPVADAADKDSPPDDHGGINEVFPGGDRASDGCGQHQMWATQFIHLNRRSR